MAVKTIDEIMEAIRKRIGEDTSDEAISLMEDVTDTFTDYETKVADKTDWKSKYDEMDASWRKKYMERFSGRSGDDIKEEQDEDVKEDGETKTFNELFKEREG